MQGRTYNKNFWIVFSSFPNHISNKTVSLTPVPRHHQIIQHCLTLLHSPQANTWSTLIPILTANSPKHLTSHKIQHKTAKSLKILIWLSLYYFKPAYLDSYVLPSQCSSCLHFWYKLNYSSTPSIFPMHLYWTARFCQFFNTTQFSTIYQVYTIWKHCARHIYKFKDGKCLI